MINKEKGAPARLGLVQNEICPHSSNDFEHISVNHACERFSRWQKVSGFRFKL